MWETFCLCQWSLPRSRGSDPLVLYHGIGQFQQDICLWGVNQDPKDSKEPPLYAPETQVLIKVWNDRPPKAQLQSTWKGPYPGILSTLTAVKIPDRTLWFTTQESNHGRTQKRIPNIPVSPWEISDIYLGLHMSAILMNTPQIKFLGIRLLRIALKSQHSLAGVVLQKRPEIDLLIFEQGEPWAILNDTCCSG